jgi:hypothetical protein
MAVLASRERASAGELGYLRGRTDGLPGRHLDLVNANGELLKVSEDNHPELFWALRGSGATTFAT